MVIITVELGYQAHFACLLGAYFLLRIVTRNKHTTIQSVHELRFLFTVVSASFHFFIVALSRMKVVIFQPRIAYLCTRSHRQLAIIRTAVTIDLSLGGHSDLRHSQLFDPCYLAHIASYLVHTLYVFTIIPRGSCAKQHKVEPPTNVDVASIQRLYVYMAGLFVVTCILNFIRTCSIPVYCYVYMY